MIELLDFNNKKWVRNSHVFKYNTQIKLSKHKASVSNILIFSFFYTAKPTIFHRQLFIK